MNVQDIYPLAQRLHLLIPPALQRWTGAPTDPSERDRLADALLWACEDAGMGGPRMHAELGEAEPIDAGEALQAVIISEALAGFLTGWGCRYGNLDDLVDRAQAALVVALGGTVHELGVYALREGTPITAAAIAYLIGWASVLDVDEAPGRDLQ